MYKHGIATYLAVAGLTATVSAVSDASAATSRTTSWACDIVQGTRMDTSFSLHNDSTAVELVAFCPIIDTNVLAKDTITSLNVHGFDGNASTNARALACESNYATTGGACGASSSSSSTGDFTLTPSLSSVWFGGSGTFGYVFVAIPAKSGSSRSNFRGYFVST